MQRIKKTRLAKLFNTEQIAFLFGCFLIALFFIIKIPLNIINRLSLYEAYILKYGTLLSGIFLIILALTVIIFHIKQVRRLLVNLALFFLTCLVLLIISEALLRIGIAEPPGVQQFDNVLHHAQIPNIISQGRTNEFDVTIKTNSLGLRDNEILPKETFDYRILMLGDSFTWGFGVEQEETFSQLLEKTFSAHGRKIDVVNAGVVSYSPILEYAYLKNYGLQLKPDIVILNFDMSDLKDDYKYEKNAIITADGELIGFSKPNAASNIALLLKLKTIDFAKGIVDNMYGRIPHKKQLNLPHVLNITNNHYAVTRFDIDEESAANYWKRSFSYIQKINELCYANNITFILSVHPYGHQVSPDEWAYGRHRFGFANDQIYSDRPEQILREFAQTNDILFNSLFEPFQQSKNIQLFFPYDGHFNKNGHELAAEVFFTRLSEMLSGSNEIFIAKENK